MPKINEEALTHYKNNKHEYYFENQKYGDKSLILTNGHFALCDMETSLWDYISFVLFNDPSIIYSLNGSGAYKRIRFYYRITKVFKKALKEREYINRITRKR